MTATPKRLLVVTTGLLFLASGLAAFRLYNKPKPEIPIDRDLRLKAYLTHLLVWPTPEVRVTMMSAPTEGGLSEVTLRGERDGRTMEERFYVSADRSAVFHGILYPVGQNPFGRNESKLNIAGRPSFGSGQALVKVVEFSDFQCPYCRKMARILRDNVSRAYPDSVAVYYFDFPLESIHPWAAQASALGSCIYKLNPTGFWSYYDWVFDNQASLNQRNLKQRALKEAATWPGVRASGLEACAAATGTPPSVRDAVELGESLQVRGTPTLFVNGRKLDGGVSWEDLRLVIDEEIAFRRSLARKRSN